MPKKKKKVIQMKSVSDTGVNTEAQHKVPERVEQYQKILPKEVFGKAAGWIYNERFRNEAKAESESESESERES